LRTAACSAFYSRIIVSDPTFRLRAPRSTAEKSSLTLKVANRGRDFADRPREVFARDIERRRDAHHGAVRVFRQDAARKQPIDDFARRHAPRVDLDADEQPAPANVDDERAVDRAQFLEQPRSQCGRACAEPFVLEHIERGQRHRGRERISAEGVAMVAGCEHLHHIVGGDEHRHRQQPAPQRLAEDYAIRLHGIVLAGEKVAGAAQAGLYLVANQQDTMLAADARAFGEIARGRHDDPALRLEPARPGTPRCSA
jgi:hypothetical protein